MQQGREKPLTLIKNIILCLVGLAGGFSISAGVFAFLVMIGILPRLAGRTHTAWAYWSYENAVMVGGIIGNLCSVYSIKIPLGFLGETLFGVGAGIFVGCLAMALTEVLNVIPIFSRRIHLRQGMSAIILSIALGKAFGSWYQLCYPVWTAK